MKELSEAIKNTGLTDKEIAKLMRISVPTVYRWRNGINNPHPFVLKGILERLKRMSK